MFNQYEYQYTRDIVLNQINQEYVNYVCHTENSNNSDYNNANYDIICYFSKESIERVGEYQYNFPDGYLAIEFDSNSYSNYNTITKTHTFSAVTGAQLNIANYEYVYSNCEGSIADIVADYKYEKNNNIGYNLDLNYSYLIILLLVLPILLSFLHHFFYVNSERS